MKIIIHSLDELLELTSLIRGGTAPLFTAETVCDAVEAAVEQAAKEVHRFHDGEPNGLPTDIAPPISDAAEEPEFAANPSIRDADGVAHSTDWHSDPAKLTDKGVWRARRGRDNDAYKAWLLEQATESAAQAIGDLAAAIDPEDYAPPPPPQDALPDDTGPIEQRAGHPMDTGELSQDEPQAPASTVNLEALIAASLEAAKDASDSHVDLLNACRDFTSKHGHPAFTALKAAVAPDDTGSGKAVQHFTPGERRLMQACIANYPSN